MRVVIIASSYYPEVNGGSSNLHLRLQLLSQWGHHVLLIVPDYSSFPMYRENCKKFLGEVIRNVHVIAFPAEPIPFIGYAAHPIPFSFKKVVKAITQFRPEIIQVESGERLFFGFMEPVGAELGRHLNIPTTVVHHTNYPIIVEQMKNKIPYCDVPRFSYFLKCMTAYVYNEYDVSFANSKPIVQYLSEYGVKNAQHIPFLGIDSTIFKPIDLNAQGDREIPQPLAHLDGPVIRFLYLGRLAAEKHVPVLLEAFTILRARHPNRVALAIVGAGERELERQVKEYSEKNKECVAYVGRVMNEVTPSYYKACDIFVNPAPFETFGLTVVEAMACGMCVVGANTAGVSEIITDGVDGMLFPAGSATALVEVLEKLVNDTTLRKRLSTKAIETGQKFSIEAGTKRMIDKWQQLSHEKTTGNLNKATASYAWDPKSIVVLFTFSLFSLLGALWCHANSYQFTSIILYSLMLVMLFSITFPKKGQLLGYVAFLSLFRSVGFMLGVVYHKMYKPHKL